MDSSGFKHILAMNGWKIITESDTGINPKEFLADHGYDEE